MNFDSNSAILNNGKPFKITLKFPSALKSFVVPIEVIDDAIKDYNVYLNKRPKVTKYVDSMRIDFLQMMREVDDFVLYAAAIPSVIQAMKHTDFTIRGDVFFAENSDTKVDKMVIKDVIYRENVIGL